MRALLDTNIVLDFLAAREPFAQAARKVLKAAEEGVFDACITAKETTDIHDVGSRAWHSKDKATEALAKLLQIVTVLDTTATDIYNSMLSDCPDFEEGVMAATALRENVDAIVTRDAKGFAHSAIPAYVPEDFLTLLADD